MSRRKVSDKKVMDVLLEEYLSDVDTSYEDSSTESENDLCITTAATLCHCRALYFWNTTECF
jgi:hypothetical protein